jgi:HAD superfamily hydrolase (TIGR01484 family)
MIMMNKKIRAIFADYDGTLCPTANLRSGEGTSSLIPSPLAETLWSLSSHIPICIISSKDFHFLVKRTPFARVFSCIMGIETVVIKRRNDISPMIDKHRLSISRARLVENARKLNTISQLVQKEFPYVTVENKLTSDDFLAGITIDWREQEDWEEPRKMIEPYVQKVVSNHNKPSNLLYMQAYSSHPFIDIYATKCDKGVGFRYVLSELKMQHDGQIMYLGDSENDNPAFRMADISIGVSSDPRLKSASLECDFMVEYDRLASFMQSILRNDVTLSSEGMKTLRLRN